MLSRLIRPIVRHQWNTRKYSALHLNRGENELVIDKEMLNNIVTESKELPESAKIDLVIALITLKYTQSNSVCYAKGGQAIGIGAGQQSRIHCTRLAGQKADNWFLRQSPKVLNLPFKEKIGRADRDNAIDLYIGDEYMDLLADGEWERTFTEKPEVFTREEKRAWLDQLRMWHLVQMLSSHSGIISREPIRAA